MPSCVSWGLPIPMDFAAGTADISAYYDNMFWRSGQDIWRRPRLSATTQPTGHLLTNFGCGPTPSSSAF
ncbi:MAG: hypothetical protein H6658_19235 [Ardenticatenaceae bacterium]|nr:hypothetical protein [Ardenticatenaceae bacterium]